MQTIHISRLFKCLLAAALAAGALFTAESPGNTTVICLLLYAFTTLWLYLSFPAFRACYTYMCTYLGVLGSLGNGAALVLFAVLSLLGIVLGLALIPIIFAASLLGLIFGDN